MTRAGDNNLDLLFVRYWDDTLTPGQAAELVARLAADPVARGRFRHFCLQAVVAADRAAVVQLSPPRSPTGSGRGQSRRAWLRYAGVGLAAGVVAGVVGPRLVPTAAGVSVRLATVRGRVRLFAPDERQAVPGFLIPSGGRIATAGPASLAVLAYPDGSAVSLTGDSSAGVADDGWRFVLTEGNAAADVRPDPAAVRPLTLATDEMSLTARGGTASVILGRGRTATEVGVQVGEVQVSTPGGARLADVRGGELLTVGADGDRRKQLLPVPPDAFAWDLSGPLPAGWRVGTREVSADGPVVLPEPWFDPYHRAVMNQIRSDGQWARGFFCLTPGSVVRVRYRVDRPGPGQVCICVRTTRSSRPDTGVLEVNGAFEEARPGEWQWLEVRAEDMIAGRHVPQFGPPWVGFLVILNTYEADLGLRVSDFRVDRPGTVR